MFVDWHKTSVGWHITSVGWVVGIKVPLKSCYNRGTVITFSEMSVGWVVGTKVPLKSCDDRGTIVVSLFGQENTSDSWGCSTISSNNCVVCFYTILSV